RATPQVAAETANTTASTENNRTIRGMRPSIQLSRPLGMARFAKCGQPGHPAIVVDNRHATTMRTSRRTRPRIASRTSQEAVTKLGRRCSQVDAPEGGVGRVEHLDKRATIRRGPKGKARVMARTGRQRGGRGLAAVLAVAVLAGACSGGEDVDVDGEGGGDGGEGGSAGGTLIAAISAEPDQFDPHKTQAYASVQVLENVYDTLVVPDAEGEFQPSLATEWTTSDDGLTWTFTLREGVTFHDGSEFDSTDVVYSYNRIIDEQLANAFRFASVADVQAPDPQTVVITLSEPTPA